MDLGTTYGPFDTVLDPGRAASFAEALNLPGGPEVVPPTFIAAATRGAMMHALSRSVPAEGLQGGVHGEQDMYWARPLAPGMVLRTMVEVRSVRVGPTGSRVTLWIGSRNEDDAPVAEQYWTTFFRGADLGPAGGPDAPDHALPEQRPAPRRTVVDIADDQPIRYGRASGEDSSIHVDAEAARAAGFRTFIVHGMASLALCAGAITDAGDPGRLRRLAARFVGVAYPGTQLEVTSYPLDALSYAFEARSPDGLVLTNGRLELRP
ncbi:MAG TPA: MaoC/PaaZ C-terminal domain-containing protein [Acidimicrobiales bacterium]